MNARNLHWAATLAAIAMSVSLSAKGQGTTGDPFLDAMISDQSAEAPAATPAPEPRPAPAAPQLPAEAPADEQAAPAPKPIETRFVSQAEDTKLVSSDEVMRELGPSTGLFGNDGAYEGKQVKSVRIRYTSGKRTVPDERLLDIIQTTEGSKYSTMRINDDLERLINRGLVGNNARVAVDPSGNGVRVTFEVQPANVMGGVGFTGNTRFSERQLREGIKLQSSKVINDRELAAARAEIIKMYQEAGYPDTRVSWRHSKTQRSEYDDIIFDITEGREVSMNHIRFEGNRQFDAQQLRQMMKTKERGLFTWITKSGRIDREQVEDDLQEIVRHYRNYGYLRARITKVEYTDNGKKTGRQKLSMKVIIDEGPRYKVRNVSFGGISVYTPQELEPGLSMLGGDIYSLQKVSDDTTMIRKYYGAKGYADAPRASSNSCPLSQ